MEAAAGGVGGEAKTPVGWSVAKATQLPGHRRAAAGLYLLETRLGSHFRRQAEITQIWGSAVQRQGGSEEEPPGCRSTLLPHPQQKPRAFSSW